MSVTIKDVAKSCGVSPSTVSRVISDNPKISETTKEKVKKAISELNYQPNAIAKSLANSATRILGLIIPNRAEDLFKNPFFINVMTGISVYAHSRNFYIMYSFSKDEQEELNYIENFIGSKLVDGIILLTSRKNDKCIGYLNKINFPFVVVGRPEEPQNILWVDNDNIKAMYNVVNIVVNKGFRKIAFISGNPEMNVSLDRLEGYKKCLLEHNIKVNKRLIVQENDFTVENGYNAMKKILYGEKPDAVVTTDDILSIGALKVIHERRLKDIFVTGFNNTVMSKYQAHPFSSVDINADKLGSYATKLLVEKLEKKYIEKDHYIVETSFIER